MGYRYRYFQPETRRPLCDVTIESIILNRDAELAAMREGIIHASIKKSASRTNSRTKATPPTKDGAFMKKIEQLSPEQIKKLLALL
jgi:hypothetical protein